ncbi:hypothetical protein Godav_000770 [Gossypium davidsonii]|uniref:Uncharacterized protein n=2 Tax=Gossypium TaxID=3633 RepID=A0A7J8T2G1_GOSDV|nr:hypothetical protein [Gossypium davidsonii]MBA0667690.1 hypothetical protein [Gossypium klotzschianum]
MHNFESNLLLRRRASPLCPLWSDGIPEEKPGPAFFSRRGSAVARSFLQLGSAVLLLLLMSKDSFVKLISLFCKYQKPDDEEIDILNHEEDFCLPQSYFVKEEP